MKAAHPLRVRLNCFTRKKAKKILCLSKGFFLFLAGAERLELPTPGFGDRCSTN